MSDGILAAPPPKRGPGRPPGSQTLSPRQKRLQERLRLLRHEELHDRATIEAIRRGAFFDARRLFDETGNLRPIHTLTEQEASCIAGIEVVRRNLEGGDGHQDTVVKIKLIDRYRYVELAARHLGLLVERVELQASDAFIGKLLEGRRRAAGLIVESQVVPDVATIADVPVEEMAESEPMPGPTPEPPSDEPELF